MSNSLGNKIKQRRIEKGIKQEVLANQLGIAQATLSRIENDKEDIGFKKMELLSKALDAPISSFTNDPIQIRQENNTFENSTGVIIQQNQDSKELIEALKKISAQKDDLIALYKSLLESKTG